jgi:hypothetical protein
MTCRDLDVGALPLPGYSLVRKRAASINIQKQASSNYLESHEVCSQGSFAALHELAGLRQARVFGECHAIWGSDAICCAQSTGPIICIAAGQSPAWAVCLASSIWSN